MKNSILTLGYPGAGKSTVSDILCKKLGYTHVEFDKSDNSFEVIRTKENVIFDCMVSNNEDVKVCVDFLLKNNFKVTLLFINTDKDICIKNIRKRERKEGTIPIDSLTIEYDFNELKNIYQNIDILIYDNYILNKEKSSKSLITKHLYV
jgi:adenylate kinase family enzyme